MKEKHPFYCHKKKCRKTAWDTPEYLTNADWLNVTEIIKVIKKKNYWTLWEFTVRGPGAKDFFNRVLGWPEGYIYCQNLSYCEKSAIHGLFEHDLELLEKALKNHKKFAS